MAEKLKSGSKDATIIEGTIGHHTITFEEKVAFIDYINGMLGHDEHLKERGLPLNKEDDSLYKAVEDGILLWFGAFHCINKFIPYTTILL